MKLRPIGLLLTMGLLTLTAPVGATTSQVDKYGRINEVPSSVHEVPAFVCDRVELIRNLVFANPRASVAQNGSAPFARENARVPDSRDSVCACKDPKPGSAPSFCPFEWPVM
jgi:hypothetical protein